MIRIVTEPKVYLIGSQDVNLMNLGDFIGDHDGGDWMPEDETSPGEALAEIGGRVCYHSFKSPRPGGNKAYLDRIISEGHGRVLEHAVWTMIIAGISRSLAQELYTHCVGFSKSMLSQRFVDESGCAFVVPPALVGPVSRTMEALNSRPSPHTGQVYLDRDSWWSDDREIGHRWLEHCEYARRKYAALVAWLERQPSGDDKTLLRKRAREAARSVLPNCVETRICLTGNARAFRHFIEMRGSRHADAEIRRLAFALLAVLKDEAPNIFGDYRIETSADGAEEIVTDHRKV